MATITAIEGIGVRNADKLRKAGLKTTEAYLQNANTPKRRKDLAEKTGISEKRILEWANHADLMRIKGVSSQYADLLAAAGVDTVKELRRRNPENLAEAMEAANARRKNKLVQRTPSAKVVTKWVDHAKDLKVVMRY